ncbi:MAG: hypothetical protein GY832_05050 [Chloroflexi bacterium]|nr:hypothetical protein [Chloroflexota bacterium]
MCPQIATRSMARSIVSDDDVGSMSTDYRKIYRPDLPIASAADAPPVRSLAVSSCFTQVVHWLVPLGQGRWSWRWGMGVCLSGMGLGRVLWFAVVGEIASE